MRRVITVLTALLLVVGIAVVLVRRDDDGGGLQARRPGPTTPAPSTTPSRTPGATATASPTGTPRPTPVGKGPRDREYDVVLAEGVTVGDGAWAIAAAGGEITREEPKVGVVTVRAGKDFVSRARKDGRIYGVVTNRAVGLPPAPEPERNPAGGQGTRRTDAGNDPLADLQWDMGVIKAPEAHKSELGDPRVLVAVIDTGVDKTHPDLVKAYDSKLSRNFVIDYPGADGRCETANCVDPVGVDEGGHGTHVAGTIVAAADRFGMRGVAPGVRLVDLRAGQDSGLFFLMPTVKALVYAGDIGVDVANLSYFVDPWLWNCPDSPDDSAADRYEQRALIEGVRRAVDYAHGKGVTMLAAAGNEAVDLDNPRIDVISPDFPDGAARRRRVSDDCHVLPTTLPHVLRVSSLARDNIKADYSDYGLQSITVTAPGGSASLANGEGGDPGYQTLSTYPEALLRAEGEVDEDGRPRTPAVVQYCAASGCGYYRYLVGTSMASPHAAGVAALIVSRFGTADPDHKGQLRMDPVQVERVLTESATPMRCPEPATVRYPRRPPEYAATCTQGGGRTSFYGAGLVNAQAALAS
jgi:subtilisin family serine protease